MKAVVKAKAEPGLWLEEVPVPKVEGDDVLIRVLKTSICGTDVHIYNWDAWAQKTIPVPMTIGHEFVGVVDDVGVVVEVGIVVELGVVVDVGVIVEVGAVVEVDAVVVDDAAVVAVDDDVAPDVKSTTSCGAFAVSRLPRCLLFSLMVVSSML